MIDCLSIFYRFLVVNCLRKLTTLEVDIENYVIPRLEPRLGHHAPLVQISQNHNCNEYWQENLSPTPAKSCSSILYSSIL